MMRRHFRVPPANASFANANTDADADGRTGGGGRTGSKSQQEVFDDYLYLTQLQQARRAATLAAPISPLRLPRHGLV